MKQLNIQEARISKIFDANKLSKNLHSINDKKDKSCTSHRNTFQHEEDDVTFQLFECLYVDI